MAYRSNRYDNRRPKYKKPPESRPSRPQSFAKHRYDFGDKEKREIREVTGDRCLRCGIQEHELDLLLAQACEKCDLNDADKNCNSGCDITSDRHLEIHHTVSKWFAAENKMDSKVIGSLNMGVCLCNECHKIMDRLAQQPDSEDDLRTLYELGKRDLSTQEITNLFRRARTKSYLAEILRIWYNRDMIVNGLEPEFLPQPDRILLRTAQAKALIKGQQKREKSNSRMRKRQPQGQDYELR